MLSLQRAAFVALFLVQGPALLRAQQHADPRAPPSSPPDPSPVAHPPVLPVPPPRWVFGASARMPILTGEPVRIGPPVGIGAGLFIQWFHRSWGGVELSIDHDRVFDRRSIPIRELDVEVVRSQNLTSTAFVVSHVFRAAYGPARFLLTLGVGAYVSFFTNAETDESRKISRAAFLPGARAGAAVLFHLTKKATLGVGFEYNWRRGSDSIPDPSGATAETFKLFYDFMNVTLRLAYHF